VTSVDHATISAHRPLGPLTATVTNNRESKNTTHTKETKKEKTNKIEKGPLTATVTNNRESTNAVLFPSLAIEGASSECLKTNVSLRTHPQ
jgi:hypothetical protein